MHCTQPKVVNLLLRHTFAAKDTWVSNTLSAVEEGGLRPDGYPDFRT